MSTEKKIFIAFILILLAVTIIQGMRITKLTLCSALNGTYAETMECYDND